MFLLPNILEREREMKQKMGAEAEDDGKAENKFAMRGHDRPRGRRLVFYDELKSS